MKQTNTLVVVPTFNPSSFVISNCLALASQGDLLVVDDGSEDGAAGTLLALEKMAIEVVRTPANRGIAHALNVGVRIALDRGYDYVLTVDQDSRPPADFVQRGVTCLIESGASFVYPESVNGAPQPVMTFAGRSMARDPMQSGMLVPLATFRQVGMFDEDLFIDCVDVDFNLRVISRGGWSAPVIGADLRHQLGETLLPSKMNGYAVHPPWRRRYIVRNRLIMYKRYRKAFPRWVLRSVVEEIRMTWRLLRHTPYTSLHARAVALGIKDFAGGRRGRID